MSAAAAHFSRHDRRAVDKQRGRQYLILGANPLVAEIMAVVSRELMDWFRAQPNTRRLIDFPARFGLVTMLSEREDLVALLPIAATLPPDVEVSDVPIDRPALVEAIELAIGLIPVVGSVVAAYEAWSGEDLFGYTPLCTLAWTWTAESRRPLPRLPPDHPMPGGAAWRPRRWRLE